MQKSLCELEQKEVARMTSNLLTGFIYLMVMPQVLLCLPF